MTGLARGPGATCRRRPRPSDPVDEGTSYRIATDWTGGFKTARVGSAPRAWVVLVPRFRWKLWASRRRDLGIVV